MSDNQNSSATKLTAIDAAHSNGKAAVLAADSFALTQSSLQAAVDKQAILIDSMQGNIYELEQQVKGISRIMSSQNVQKLTENLHMAQDDLKRSLLFEMNEKYREIVNSVEKEVSEVSDTKIGLLKKIDAVEQSIMAKVSNKLDEAAHSRKMNAEKIERLEDFMETLPALSEKNTVIIKSLEGKLSDLRNEFRVFVSEQSANDREQDRSAMALTSEVRTALESAKDRIAEETKSLSRLIHKRENLLKEEVHEVKELIGKEAADRGDSLKSIQKFVKDEVEKVKVHAEQKIHAIEGSAKYEVRPCIAALKEMKRAVEEEACHRDSADKDLARRIAKEIQERHTDEERLVSLISTTQEAVAKLRKA